MARKPAEPEAGEETALRRQPRQERSRRLLEAILDAAALVLA